MKTKNMRKKALLSSVAMLLVAIVALSGATYAWWTTNNSVDATGIKFATQNQSTLLIAAGAIDDSNNETSAFDRTLAANWGTAEGTFFTPVSTTFGKTAGDTDAADIAWYAVNPSSETEPVNYGNQKVASFTSGGTNYIHERVWFQNAAAGDICVGSISWGTAGIAAKDITNALRMGIVNANGDKFVYAPATLGSNTKWAIASIDGYDADASVITYGQLYSGTTGKGVNYVDMSSKITATGTNNGTAIASVGAGGKTYVDVYFWLEGNTVDCSNSVAGGLNTGISITFGMKTTGA